MLMPQDRIPVARPRLPQAEALMPFLREIDRNRIYSNFGPLNARFQAALAAHYDLPPECVITVVNGTVGLILSLMAFGKREGGYCLMPSWNFAAAAHAALAVGMVPYFLDVAEDTWALDPGHVADVLDKLGPRVAAVMPVFPFGQPLETSDWNAIGIDSGIPVVIDAAAGFDSLVPDDVPAVVSLHATKVLGVGEGAFVISRRPEIIREIELRANFGFRDRREALVPSLNGKLNEYNAAVGLASLAEWETIREEYASCIRCYRQQSAQGDEFSLQPGFGDQWVATTCTVLLQHLDASDCKERLLNMGIDTRAWYGQGLHLQSAFHNLPRDGDLPVTQMLSRQTIGLPLYRGMGDTVIERVSRACFK